MKIDEALQILEHETAFDVRWCDEHRCGTALEMVCNELKIALEKLQWYKSQDLIRREEAIRIAQIEIMDGENNSRYRTKCAVYHSLKQIPKAEPPIDECTPNCEKRFTCKHCIQGMYCNSRKGNEDGTPCCCEPEV